MENHLPALREIEGDEIVLVREDVLHKFAQIGLLRVDVGIVYTKSGSS